MKKILSVLMLLILFGGIGIYAVNSGSKDVLTLKTGTGDIVSAFPLLDNTVLVFEGDSVVIKKEEWRSAVHKSEITYFDHLEELNPDMRVSLITNDTLRFPVAGSFVTLHNEYFDDFFGIIQIADEEGRANIKNLPVGYYSIYVNDALTRFEPRIIKYHHATESDIELVLSERIKGLKNLNFSIEPESQGWYEVTISWETESETEGYRYLVYVNGEYHGETPNNSYCINGLLAGDYEIGVIPVSEFENISSKEEKISIRQADFLSSAIPEILEGRGASVFYNLNGQIVTNPGPGIYVCDGKKLIIR